MWRPGHTLNAVCDDWPIITHDGRGVARGYGHGQPVLIFFLPYLADKGRFVPYG